MQEMFGTALILITHDLGVVADIADDVMVMYGGRCMERRRPARRCSTPATTRTPRACCSLMPAYGGGASGSPDHRPAAEPDPPPPGCPFAPRCAYVMDRCERDARARPGGRGPGHLSACWLPHPGRPRGVRRRGARRAGQVGRTGGSVRTMASAPESQANPVPAALPTAMTCCCGWRTWSSTSRSRGPGCSARRNRCTRSTA